jgi:hypothetical protein
VFSFLKKLSFLMILSINIFATTDFTYPTTTPDVSPNLADRNGTNIPSGSEKVITDSTDSSGQYVYAIWSRLEGPVNRIQVCISSDFGDTWSNPANTVYGTPNLSEQRTGASDGNTEEPQITNSDNGQYVYAIWTRSNGTNTITQTAYSSDYGQTWSAATDLSATGQNSSQPQITASGDGVYVYATWFRFGSIQTKYSSDNGQTWSAVTDLSATANIQSSSQIVTSNSGQYVYAIWQASGSIIQTKYSSDNGQNWSAVTDLSASGAIFPQIITNKDSTNPANDGKYVYAVWSGLDGVFNRIQAAVSSDNGQTWNSPTSTPASDGTPNLSQPGGFANRPQITTCSDGQYVYAIWERFDGTINRIQTAVSSDNGLNWDYPTSTPALDGTPNLSQPRLFSIDGTSGNPNIVTDSTGKYVYAIWRRSTDILSNSFIQVAISADNGLTWTDPTSTPQGTPNISTPGDSANFIDISISSNGEYIYATWFQTDGSLQGFQVANGILLVPIKKVGFPVVLIPIMCN